MDKTAWHVTRHSLSVSVIMVGNLHIVSAVRATRNPST